MLAFKTIAEAFARQKLVSCNTTHQADVCEHLVEM